MPVLTYGVKYRAGWASRDGLLQGYLIIDKLDYVGAETALTLSFDSIVIRYAFSDWNDPILGLQCEFTIENDKTDFFELFPLLKAEEQEYRVRVTVFDPSEYQYFEGFLNVENITHKYLRFQNIRFAASNYINKLNDIHPLSLDTLQNMNFLTIIQELFKDTGYYHHILINCKLFAEGDILTSLQTLFTKNGFNTEVFWKDKIERSSSLEVLKAILSTFDCYIYWLRGYWYIERYEDIWTPTEEKTYVDYTATTEYLTYDSEGALVTIANPIYDLHDLIFTDRSQEISVIPGLRTIQINLQDNRYETLIQNDLYNIVDRTSGTPLPANRTWEKWSAADSMLWLLAGKSKNTITNSIQRVLTIPLTSALSKGIYTRFKTTVGDTDTSISIQFKYIIDPIGILNYTGKLADYIIVFHWYLKVLPLENFIFQSTVDSSVWNMTIGTEDNYLQRLEKPGSDFDLVNNSCDVSISVPLGLVKIIDDDIEMGALTGDLDLLFAVGIETVKINDTEFTSPVTAWLGDFQCTSTGDVQDNVITGTVTTKFLKKKEIPLMLYDCESYNYKNAILRGSDYLIRTERWGIAIASLNIVTKGVCWGVSVNPTIAGSKTDDGTGIDSFTSILSGLTQGTTYHVRAYYTDAEGTTVYGTDKTFVTLDLSEGVYYHGGQIGYIFVEGDPGYIVGEVHGIIVALQDQEADVWCRLADVPRTCGATSQDIRDGTVNTNLMLAETTNIGKYAAKKCGDYTDGTYTDWMLPTNGDLTKIQGKRDLLSGRFRNAWYWSSTELVDNPWPSRNWRFACARNLGIAQAGSTYTYEKNRQLLVCPCRYF